MDSAAIKALVKEVRVTADPAELAIEIMGAMAAVITRLHGAKHTAEILRGVAAAMERGDG